MGNFFDQFDEEQTTEKAAGNFFDQFDEEQTSEVTNLPAPSPNMFASMDDADAKAVYESYKNHPNAQVTEDGSLTYNGQVVPAPEGNNTLVDTAIKVGSRFLNPAGEIYDYMTSDDSLTGQVVDVSNNLSKGLVGGGINAAKNAIELGTTVAVSSPIVEFGRAAYEQVTGNDTNIPVYDDARDATVKGVQDYVPQFNPEGTAQHLGATGGEVAAGMVLGNAAVNALKSAGASEAVLTAAMDKLPKAGQYIGRVLSNALANSLGTAATVDGKGDTLIVGADAHTKLPQEWLPLLQGLDGKSESEVQAIMERRFNVLMDGMVIAAPVEVAADGVKAIASFGYEAFLRPFVTVGSQSAREKQVTETLLKELGKVVGNESPEQLERIRLNLLDILKDPDNRKIFVEMLDEGIDNVDVTLDTGSVLERGLNKVGTEEAKILSEGIKRQRKQVVDSGGLIVDAAMDRPQSALKKLTEQTEKAFGGNEAMRESSRTLRETGQKMVDEAATAVDDATTALEKAKSADDVFTSDPGLGKRLAEASGEAGSKTFQVRNQVTDEILQTIDEGLADISKTNKEIWEKIPNGLPIDEKSFNQVVADADKFLSAPTKRLIEEAGGDFGILQRTLRKPLSDALKQAEKSGTGYEELKALRDNLTSTQPSWLKEQLKNGVLPDVAKKKAIPLDAFKKRAAKAGEVLDESLDYYTNTKSKVESGAVKEIKDVKYNNRFDAPTIRDKSGEILDQTLKSEQPARVAHLAETLARPEFKGKQGLLVDYAFADMADNLRTAMRGGDGLTSVDVKPILGEIDRYRQMFNAPQFGDAAKRLDDFEKAIIDNKNNIKNLEAVLGESADKLKVVQDEIYGVVLKDFMEKNGMSKGEGFEVVSKLFKGDGAIERTKSVLELARKSGNPAVEDGMKAAYGRYLDQLLFTAEETSSGAMKISPSNAQKTMDASNAALSIGDELFGADSPVMIAVRELIDPSLNLTRGRKIAGAEALKTGIGYRDAKEAQTRLVNIFIGPLTRTGARIGAFTSAGLRKLGVDEAPQRILTQIFADPDEFTRILEGLQVSGLKDNRGVRNAFLWLVRTGVVDESDFDTWKKEFEKLNTENQTEEAFAK